MTRPLVEIAADVRSLLDPDVSEDEIDEDPAPSLPKARGFSKADLDLIGEVFLALDGQNCGELADRVAAHFGIDTTA